MLEILLLLKATAVAAVALLAVRLARRARAAVRALVLTGAFVVLLLLPVATVMLPPLPVDVAPGTAGLAMHLPTLAAPGGDRVTSRAPVGDGGARASTGLPGDGGSPALPAPVFLTIARTIWLFGVLAVLARLVVGLREIRRLRQAEVPWPDEAPDAARVVGGVVPAGIEVFLHPRIAAPVTYGWLRPRIGLPLDAAQWPPGDLRRALIHETEHVRRADWLVHLLVKVVCAVYWFHPLVWVAAHRLRLDSEHACDDAVVQHDEGSAYAQQLVTLARRLTAHARVESLSIASCTNLSRRIAAVLDPSRRRGSVGVGTATATLVAALALALAVAPLEARLAGAATSQSNPLSIPTALADRAFDTVVVARSNASGDRGRLAFDPETGRFTAHNHSLRSLVALAYSPIPAADLFASWPASELPEWRLRGGPDWMDSERFTIEGASEEPLAVAALPAMVRRMLSEHFGLVVHIEQQAVNAYRLSRAHADGRLGPGLRPAGQPCADEAAGGGPGVVVLRCTNLPAWFAGYHLMEVLGGPVVDDTGLTGAFDVSLSFSPTDEELSTIYALSRADLPPELLAQPPITSALEQQLGLKLEPITALLDTLVIDDAQRPSSR